MELCSKFMLQKNPNVIHITIAQISIIEAKSRHPECKNSII